jgi:IclR family KDG regulon transcriptional repressor
VPDYTIGVVEDTIHVLETVMNSKDRLTLAEITKKSGLVKNKVFRILSTLEKHRLVHRDEAGAYGLGLRLLEFGQQVQNQMSLLAASRPVMDWLVEETAESIFLTVIEGTEVLVVDARESPRSIRLFGKVGRRAPLYAGGTPKVLLAFLPEEKRKALLDSIELKPITPYTVTDPIRLEALLCQIRQQGYVVTADDLDVGAHSIAAPIRDYQGQVMAAISIAGPSHRFTDACIESYVRLVLTGASQISRALGYKDGQQPAQAAWLRVGGSPTS